MKNRALTYFLIFSSFFIITIFIPTAFIKDSRLLAIVQTMSTLPFIAIMYQYSAKKLAYAPPAVVSSTVIDEMKHYENIRQALFNSSVSITESASNEMFEDVIENAMSIIPNAEAGTITLIDNNGNMNYVAGKNFDIQLLNSLRMDFTDSFLYKESKGYVSSPILIEDIRKYDQDVFSEETSKKLIESSDLKIISTLSAPIYKDGKIVGAINLDSTRNGAFDENDKQTINYISSVIGVSLKFKDVLYDRTQLLRNDKLTGAYNRVYFEEVFLNYQNDSYKKNNAFSLVIMDLNYIKFINDSFGRIHGDLAISKFSDTVKGLISEDDIFARFGGDEFILILNDTSKSDALKKLNELSDAVEEIEIEYMSRRIPIQFSYGISYCPEESMILDILIKIADNRMHKHKELQKSETMVNKNFDDLFSTTREMIVGIEEIDLKNKL